MRSRILLLCLLLVGCDSTLQLGSSDSGTASRDARGPTSPDATGTDGGVPDAAPADGSASETGPAPSSDAASFDAAGFVGPGVCEAACESATIACGDPDAEAIAGCAAICSSAATPDQVMCLAMSSCGTLQGVAAGGGTVCGIGALPPRQDGGAQPGDAGGATLLLTGGDSFDPNMTDDWTWNGSDWTESLSILEPAWIGAAMATLGGAPVYFEGNQDTTSPSQTFVWSAPEGWGLTSPQTAPSGRAFPAMSALGNVLVLFGGSDLNDTWTWNGSNWTQLGPPSSPPPRTYAMAATLANKVVLFGGAVPAPNSSVDSDFLNDTWTWDGTSWTQAHPATSPPARSGGTMATLGSTVVLFGGQNTNSSDLDDTWTWDGTNWTQRQSLDNPPPRLGAAMATFGNIVLLFGGGVLNGDAINIVYFLDDTWSWDGTKWTQLSPATTPGARAYATMSPL